MQRETENLESVQAVTFEIDDSLKNNGTKHWLLVDVFCEESCNLKAFVDIASRYFTNGGTV